MTPTGIGPCKGVVEASGRTGKGYVLVLFSSVGFRADDRVCIDEATSALDVASRVRVFEALKTRRRHKTVVIAHDLAQMNQEDLGCVTRIIVRGRMG